MPTASTASLSQTCYSEDSSKKPLLSSTSSQLSTPTLATAKNLTNTNFTAGNNQTFLEWFLQTCRVQQKIVMFMIGVSFHIFSVFRYNYLMDCVGTTRNNYSYASSVVCLASFFVSNIWVFIAQRSRLLFGTFVASSFAGSACLLAIRMLQHPEGAGQPFWLFMVKFCLFCIFFGCLKSFFSIAATATIKNLTDRKYYAEQFCFFLLGSIAVNMLFSFKKFESVMLNMFWIGWTVFMLIVFKITVGVDYFDVGLEKKSRLVAFNSVSSENHSSSSSESNSRERSSGESNNKQGKIIDNRSRTDEPNENAGMNPVPSTTDISNNSLQSIESNQQRETEEGYKHLFSNANYRFFLLITTLVGYTCSTFIIFAPSLQEEDLLLSISERTKIESFGNVAELLVYTTFRFIFAGVKPYTLAMICCLSFLMRALGYVIAVAINRLSAKGAGFWIILCSDSLKGLVFGMLQPAYITFIAWYCSENNKSIALGVYNGIFYGVTGFACGIGSGALRQYLHERFKTVAADTSLWKWLLGTNCSAFFIAIVCQIVAIALLVLRFWVFKIGRKPDFDCSD